MARVLVPTTIALVAVLASALFITVERQKSRELEDKVRKLEATLKESQKHPTQAPAVTRQEAPAAPDLSGAIRTQLEQERAQQEQERKEKEARAQAEQAKELEKAQAQMRQFRRRTVIEPMAQALNVQQHQLDAFTRILERMFDRVQEATQEHINQLASPSNTSREDVEKATQAKIDKLREEAEQELAGVLTPEQLRKLKTGDYQWPGGEGHPNQMFHKHP